MGKYTAIDDPSAYFQVKKWTGNAGTNVITLDGNSDMRPDFMWHKEQNDTNGWHQFDSSRGVTKYLASQGTAAEGTFANYLTSFDSNGFTAGSGDSSMNSSGTAQCSWMWHCNGGTTATNNDGTVTTTTQVNSDAGFSIVTWAGGGTGTLGHGLGETPDMWIIKNRDYAVSWAVGFSDSNILGGRSKYLSLNTAQAILTYNNLWGTSDAQISSTTIGAAGDRTINISGDDYVGYFFKAKQGYSKFGKYVSNGNTDGPFVYTGFKPAFVIIKSADAAKPWVMKTAAISENPINEILYPNLTNAEGSDGLIDFVSNGFKVREGPDANINNSLSDKFIYMAFAENPFVTSTGIMGTAR